MLYFLLFALAFTNHHQASETVFLTTASKISMSYVDGGSTLAGRVSKDDKFAMNGQMYKSPGYRPVGLYIENRKRISKLVLVDNPKTNFGITPQGVFFVDTNNVAGLVDAKKCNEKAYKYATQIAPIILIDGVVN